MINKSRILSPKSLGNINKQTQANVTAIALGDAECYSIFSEFQPNPGGQTQFFNIAQWKFNVNLEHKWLALLGGINSGKSFAGAVWACSRALIDPVSRGMISANSYGQLARATLLSLVEVCRIYNIPLEPYRDSPEDQALAIANCRWCRIGPEKSFVYVMSAGAFTGATQAGRGLQIRWFWGDEFAYAPQEAFLTIDGRLGRGSGKMKGQGIITTSPCGHNYLWDKFGNDDRNDSLKKLYKMVSVSSLENKYSSEDYIESLKANYSDELYKQEILGLFINVTEGLIYKYFDRTKHTLSGEDAQILDYNPAFPLMLSFDFNYNPAVCIAAQMIRGELHVFKEWFLLDSDLWELTNTIKDWIMTVEKPLEIHIFGDATGRARTANSRLSSWDIVFESMQGMTRYPGAPIRRRFADSNPHVQNRIHSVNQVFRKNICIIDRDKCQNLIKDFDQITWQDKSINKDDPLRSHLSDAFGYLVHVVCPFKPEPKGKDNAKIKGIAS